MNEFDTVKIFSIKGKFSRSSPGTSTPSSGKSINKLDSHDLDKSVSFFRTTSLVAIYPFYLLFMTILNSRDLLDCGTDSLTEWASEHLHFINQFSYLKSIKPKIIYLVIAYFHSQNFPHWPFLNNLSQVAFSWSFKNFDLDYFYRALG